MKVRTFVPFSMKMLRCKARARKSQYANTQRLTTAWSICVLCVPRRHQKMQRRACIASRMLSSSVVSPCRTGKRPRPKTKPSPSISDKLTTHAFTYACAKTRHLSFWIEHTYVHVHLWAANTYRQLWKSLLCCWSSTCKMLTLNQPRTQMCPWSP